MGVVSIRKLFAGQTGELSAKKVSYGAAWMVEVSSELDDQPIILNALRPGLGTLFNWGLGFDLQASLQSLSCTRVPDSRLWWLVEGNWESIENENDQEQRDEQGNSSDDPLDWRDRVERGAAKFTAPVEKAVLLTDLSGIGRAENSEGPVVNAAGDIFDPPIEVEEAHGIYRVTRNMRDFPTELADEYENAINKESYTIRLPGMKKTFKPFTLKAEPIVGQLQYHPQKNGNVFAYWSVTSELHHNKKTWLHEPLNRGFNRRQAAGDPDGRGGTISNTDLVGPDGKPNGKPGKALMTDAEDNPTGPNNLDLNGQPLPPTAPPVYLKYRCYAALPFSKLNKIWG